MVLKILISRFFKILLKFAILKFFEYCCPFLSLAIITEPPQTKKMVLNIFHCVMRKLFLLNFVLSVFFFDLIIMLESSKSNLTMEISLILFLCWLGLLSFSFSFTFFLLHTLSLSTLLLIPHFSCCYVA